MKKILFLILALILVACTSPQVTATRFAEATVTLPPPTATIIPTPTLNPQFTALQEQIAASGERFSLMPDGTIQETTPDGVKTVSGLWVNKNGEINLLVIGEKTALSSDDVSFDDEDGVKIKGYELDEKTGEWVKILSSEELFGFNLCATTAEADQHLCIVPLEDAMTGVASKAAKLNAPPVPQEIIDGLATFQPDIVAERSRRNFADRFKFSPETEAYYRKLPEAMPVESIGYFTSPKSTESSNTDYYTGIVWRWTQLTESGKVESRYVTVLYVTSAALLESGGPFFAYQIIGKYYYDVPIDTNPLVAISKDPERNAMLDEFERTSLISEAMEHTSFIGNSNNEP